MKEKRFKFTRVTQAVQRASRLGWRDMTERELNAELEKSVDWSVRDSANLTRIADALEKLANTFSKKI